MSELRGQCIDHGQVGIKSPWGGNYGTGYALIETGKKRIKLHRLIFETYYGYRPDVVMHLCDNTRCINVFHLEAGTFDSNNKDRARKGRSAENVHSKRRLTEEQVREIRRDFIPGSPKGSPHGVQALARRFSVDPNVIYQVHQRGTYRDVA